MPGPRLIRLVNVTLCVIHTVAVWNLLGGRQGILGREPILIHDHTFHYYYAVSTRAYLRLSGTTAGYDPYFMAGYAKSILFPSSSTLAEVILTLAQGLPPAPVYKSYVFLAAGILPWLMWLAIHLWPTSESSKTEAVATPVVLVFSVLYFWTDWGLYYVHVGMVPFALSGPITVLAGAAAARFIHCGGVRSWLAAACVMASAFLIHVCAMVVLAPGLIAAALIGSQRASFRRAIAFGCLPVVSLLVNLFWILPAFVLAPTLETTATGIGFINPNVVKRFVEFVTERPIVEPMTLVLIPIGLAVWRRGWRPAVWFVAVTLVWTFFLGYPAGWIRQLDVLQPARYSYYVFVWGAIPAGWGASWLFALIAGRSRRPACVYYIVLVVVSGAGAFLCRDSLLAALAGGNQLTTAMHPSHRQLINRLKQLVSPGERVFFEERNRGIDLAGRQLLDPLGDFRLSPLIPLETGAELIGGPYLYTHLSTNFTQFGDGRFMAKDRWTAEQFTNYAGLYDVKWLVCWSPYAQEFCLTHHELIRPIEFVKNPAGRFLIGKVLSHRLPRIRPGRATVEPQTGGMRVTVHELENGRVVLPYHWVPCLASVPPVVIERVWLLDDPVPFIGLVDPPARVELFLDLFRGVTR